MCTFETPLRGLAARLTRATGVALALFVAPACTLITNVDREKIPIREQPSFPQTNDGGIDEDAAVPNGNDDPDAAVDSDAGDAAADAAATDAEAPPSGDAGDAGDAG